MGQAPKTYLGVSTVRRIPILDGIKGNPNAPPPKSGSPMFSPKNNSVNIHTSILDFPLSFRVLLDRCLVFGLTPAIHFAGCKSISHRDRANDKGLPSGHFHHRSPQFPDSGGEVSTFQVPFVTPKVLICSAVLNKTPLGVSPVHSIRCSLGPVVSLRPVI